MIIEQIQKDIRDHALRDEFFANVPLIIDDKGEMDAQVEKAMASGLSVVLELEEGEVQFKNVGSGAMTLNAVFTIEETVALNRDETNPSRIGKKATDVVEALFRVFSPNSQVPVPCCAKTFRLINNVGGVIAYSITAPVLGGWYQPAA